MGGAANYIRTLAAELALHPEHEYYLVIPPEMAEPISRLAPHIHILVSDLHGKSLFRRFCINQVKIPLFLRSERIDVLFSSANFSTFGSFFFSCRQVLLMRNSLYFSTLYREKILPKKGWRARFSEVLRRFLARRPARAADVVITPSQSMLSELRSQVPLRAACVNPYGVDRSRFNSVSPPFSPQGVVRLLFTSLYAEHKNFATLLRALLRLHAAGGPKCRLITTSDPAWEPQIHNPIRASDRALVSSLQQLDMIELTGVISGAALDQLYRRADIFVYPSVIESFGHPLLEAMASALPVVAADVLVNKELCGDAALYFSPSDEAGCARQIELLIHDPNLRQRLVQKGLERVERFQWSTHARVLLQQFATPTQLVANTVESHA